MPMAAAVAVMSSMSVMNTTTAAVDECQLLDDFGKFVQLLAAVIAFSVLIVKRFRERPRRPWSIWGLDVMKQATSGLGAHFVGLITATIVAGVTVGISPCSWYFVAFTVDVTLGVTISLLIFHFGQQLAKKYRYAPLETTGNYGQVVDQFGIVTKKPSMRIWTIQMAYFTFACVIPARFVCLVFTYSLRYQLSGVAQWVHSGFVGEPHAELLFVMVAGPCLMNAVQFLIQDSVLKLHKRRSATESPISDDQDNGLIGETEMTSDSSALSLSSALEFEEAGLSQGGFADDTDAESSPTPTNKSGAAAGTAGAAGAGRSPASSSSVAADGRSARRTLADDESTANDADPTTR